MHGAVQNQGSFATVSRAGEDARDHRPLRMTFSLYLCDGFYAVSGCYARLRTPSPTETSETSIGSRAAPNNPASLPSSARVMMVFLPGPDAFPGAVARYTNERLRTSSNNA